MDLSNWSTNDLTSKKLFADFLQVAALMGCVWDGFLFLQQLKYESIVLYDKYIYDDLAKCW